MKKTFLLFLTLAFFHCVILYSQGSDIEKQNTTQDIAKKIDSLIGPLANSSNYSGKVLVQRGAELLFSKSYGFFDIEKQIKHSAQSKFLIGSVSAIFTSAAIMKLVDEGKLSVEDKLSKFLAGFPYGDKVSIHHLLTERSGLPRYGTGRGHYKQLIQSPHTLEELVGFIKELQLQAEPGNRHIHSGSSFILLARIIEVVSGKGFGEFLKEEIFDPLGMKNTGHYSDKIQHGDIANLSIGYEQAGVTALNRAELIHWSSKIGHASIYSTTEDLHKFANAILNKQLLSAKSWQKMLSPYFGISLGYGISTVDQGSRRLHSRSGGSPGFSSFFAVYPDDDLVIIMLSNIKIHVPYFTVPNIAAIVFNEPYEKLNLKNPPHLDATFAQQFLGEYQFDEHFYNPNGTVTISYKDGLLWSDGAPMLPVLDDQGNIIKFINRRFWSRLEFKSDHTGNISELKFDDYTGTKKGLE